MTRNQSFWSSLKSEIHQQEDTICSFQYPRLRSLPVNQVQKGLVRFFVGCVESDLEINSQPLDEKRTHIVLCIWYVYLHTTIIRVYVDCFEEAFDYDLIKWSNETYETLSCCLSRLCLLWLKLFKFFIVRAHVWYQIKPLWAIMWTLYIRVVYQTCGYQKSVLLYMANN